ncbi:MAG: MFS transporter [Anaerolineae bacterium]
MAATTRRVQRYPALRHRNFTLLWAGLLVSNMGTWMQNVAQSWLIYKLTGNDPIYLGYLGLSFALPMTFLPPVGGMVVDRVDRIKLLYVTQTGSMLAAFVMAILAWTGRVEPWEILLSSFVWSCLLAFDNPARQSLIPNLVPREDLLNALALNSATYTGAALVGPAIAGVLLNIVGAGWLFFLNAVSFLAVIGALALMHHVPRGHHPPTTMRDALFGGFIYAWRHQLILALLIVSALGSLFARSYQQLLPIFADDIWHAGSSGYGWLLAAGGGGALIAAFVLSSIPQIRHQGKLLLTSGFAMSLSLVAFALSRSFLLGMLTLFIVSAASNVFGTMIATSIQLHVPNQLRGRVMSLYATTLIGLPSLGALAVAAIAVSLGAYDQSRLSQAIESVFDVLGINGATAWLGPTAGAPRAVVLGALMLVAVLIAVTPMFWPLTAPVVVASERSLHRAEPEKEARP